MTLKLETLSGETFIGNFVRIRRDKWGRKRKAEPTLILDDGKRQCAIRCQDIEYVGQADLKDRITLEDLPF